MTHVSSHVLTVPQVGFARAAWAGKRDGSQSVVNPSAVKIPDSLFQILFSSDTA
jgi:hypothetical protein